MMACITTCVILLSLVTLVACDVTDIATPAGVCLVTTTVVNVRDSACGNLIGEAPTGNAYIATGESITCTLNGVLYDFHAVDFQGQTSWMAGDYLIIDRTSKCTTVTPPSVEWRAMWIATVYNIDWPESATDSSDKQQQDLIDYLDMADQLNFNVVVFQVRPVGDALYGSNYEPWSKYLTGVQGVPPDPFYEPLTFLCEEAHARGIEVHVWLNPYRANMAPNTDGLAFNHMAMVYPQYAYPYGNYLWMDPGAQVIIDHLIDVISDILDRYDVDGIHFDDYFYPYPVEGVEFPDDATYADYVASGGQLSRDDWRRDNVNRMVQTVQSVIAASNEDQGKSVKFSISPFGLYRPGHPEGMPDPIAGLDPYTAQFADSKKWVEEAWVDFLVPQLYWAVHPPAQSYPTVLDWWCDVGSSSGVNIYAGNALYKLEPGEDDWPLEEIGVQIDISRALKDKLSLGNCQYSAKYIRDDYKGLRSLFQELYSEDATVP